MLAFVHKFVLPFVFLQGSPLERFPGSEKVPNNSFMVDCTRKRAGRAWREFHETGPSTGFWTRKSCKLGQLYIICRMELWCIAYACPAASPCCISNIVPPAPKTLCIPSTLSPLSSPSTPPF